MKVYHIEIHEAGKNIQHKYYTTISGLFRYNKNYLPSIVTVRRWLKMKDKFIYNGNKSKCIVRCSELIKPTRNG